MISKKGNGFGQPRNKQLNWRRVRSRNRKKLGAKKGDSIPPASKSEFQVTEESPTPNSPNTEFKIDSKVVRPTKHTNLGSRISSGRTEIIRKPFSRNEGSGRE